jgi:hypothetical protein
MFFTAEVNRSSQGWRKHPSYYMPREGGLTFLMSRPAAIYIKIGAANAVLTAHAGTGRSPV